MTKLEQHRKTWQGKSDEWLFERLANELTQKVEEIHRLLAENEQLLRSSNVVEPKEKFYCDERDKYGNTECNQQCMACVRDEQAQHCYIQVVASKTLADD